MTRVAVERAARAAIETDVLAWMESGEWTFDETRFEALALRLFAHQFEHCAPYRRFCEMRSSAPSRIARSEEIPAVPTGAFKEATLCCFPESDAVKVFRTSGTTGSRRGALALDTLALYEASLLPTIRRLLFPTLPAGERARVLVLAPPPTDAPDSSLSHMFGELVTHLGDRESAFHVTGGRLAVASLAAALDAAIEDRKPVAVCGTAFAFVHWLEARKSRALPPGSLVMETGGFKGRSREMPQPELYAAIEEHLGVPAARIVNQYGMTELGSQFYDSVIAEPEVARRKLGPPWARARVVDPESLREVAPGEVGMIVVHDLANTGSIAAIETADLGRRSDDGRGFEVLGRDAAAEERGCSIAADTMLSTADTRLGEADVGGGGEPRE